MVNDLIGDSLTRIRNSLNRQHEFVNLSYSKMINSICEIMKDYGYIVDFEIQEIQEESKKLIKKEIKVELNYKEEEKGSLKKIHKLKRVSRPGLRIYRGYRQLKPILSGNGIAIVSTPKGVISDIKARKNKVGGEIICIIY